MAKRRISGLVFIGAAAVAGAAYGIYSAIKAGKQRKFEEDEADFFADEEDAADTDNQAEETAAPQEESAAEEAAPDEAEEGPEAAPVAEPVSEEATQEESAPEDTETEPEEPESTHRSIPVTSEEETSAQAAVPEAE